MREVQRRVPFKVLGFHGNGIERELHALVGDFSDVGLNGAKRVDERRNRVGPNQVFGLLVIELQRTVEPSAKDSVVDTEVKHARCLPLQVFIGQFRGTQRHIGHAIALEIGAGCAIRGHGRVGSEAQGIATDTVTEAEFQVRKDALVFHESLFGDVPCCAYRGESTPTVVFTKHGRAITTQGCLKHIAAVERIPRTSIERNIAHRLLRSAVHSLHSVYLSGVSEVIPFQRVIEEVVHGEPEAIVAVALFPRITSHQGELVHFVEGLVVVGIGFKSLRIAEVGVAVGLAIIGTQARQLRVVRVVCTVSVLEVVVGIVHVQEQAVDDVQGCLADELIALPKGLGGVF